MTTCSCTGPQPLRRAPRGLPPPPASSWCQIQPLWNKRASLPIHFKAAAAAAALVWLLCSCSCSSDAQSWKGDTSGTPGHSHFLILAQHPQLRHETSHPHTHASFGGRLKAASAESPRRAPKSSASALAAEPWALLGCWAHLGTQQHQQRCCGHGPLQQIAAGPVPSRRGTTHTYTWPDPPFPPPHAIACLLTHPCLPVLFPNRRFIIPFFLDWSFVWCFFCLSFRFWCWPFKVKFFSIDCQFSSVHSLCFYVGRGMIHNNLLCFFLLFSTRTLGALHVPTSGVVPLVLLHSFPAHVCIHVVWCILLLVRFFFSSSSLFDVLIPSKAHTFLVGERVRWSLHNHPLILKIWHMLDHGDMMIIWQKWQARISYLESLNPLLFRKCSNDWVFCAS